MYNLVCVVLIFSYKVEACRVRLFAMASLDMTKDETPKPTGDWKESCIKAIIPKVVICTVY